MAKENFDNPFSNLPACAANYIRLVIKKMRWRKKIRADVQAELIAHFEDALKDCKTNEEKENTAKEIINEFGDAKMLGVLARRAKKRCRPLWQKVLIHSLQILGIIFIYISICGIYLSTGKPTISVNYVEWLNNYVRRGRDNSLNCAPLLKEAVELIKPMPKWLEDSNATWPNDFNELQLEDLENWLRQNKQAFDILEIALTNSCYWNIYDTNQCAVYNFFPSLSNYPLAKIMNWQIRYSAFKSNLDEATDKAIELCDFGQRMEGNGTLIEQLVGIAIEAIGHSAILEMLDRTTPTAEQLEKLQNFFRQHCNNKVIDLGGEKAFVYDFVQRGFTDDGKGGGKPVKQGIGFVGKNRIEVIFNILTFNLPDKKEVIEQIDNIYDTYQQRFESPDFESTKEKFNQAVHNAPMLMQITLPAFDKVNELSWRVKTHRDGLITTLAVLRYHKQTNKYPESLEELLKAGYITRMPFDIYRNGSLTYRKTDTGFTLYSFGNDRDDDGGKMGVNKGGKPNLWNKDDGDVVFWPVTHPNK